ncbi:MAG: hypothetical protein Kow0073_12610 [Immundisolibacter sp.]
MFRPSTPMAPRRPARKRSNRRPFPLQLALRETGHRAPIGVIDRRDSHQELIVRALMRVNPLATSERRQAPADC